MSEKWKVDIKGDHKNGSWEISVYDTENHTNPHSWGWFGKTKHFIANGGGCTCPWQISDFVYNGIVELAEKYCSMLNSLEKETYQVRCPDAGCVTNPSISTRCDLRGIED